MNPWELLGKTKTPAGDEMTLMLRSGEYVILASGKTLMSSRMHGSEEALAALGHLFLELVAQHRIDLDHMNAESLVQRRQHA